MKCPAGERGESLWCIGVGEVFDSEIARDFGKDRGGFRLIEGDHIAGRAAIVVVKGAPEMARHGGIGEEGIIVRFVILHLDSDISYYYCPHFVRTTIRDAESGERRAERSNGASPFVLTSFGPQSAC